MRSTGRAVNGCPPTAVIRYKGVPVNPYLATGLAMCGVIFLALVGTAWLAVFFNRRAKADLAAALHPLAEIIDGEVDVDEATIAGRWHDAIVQMRVTNAPIGAGRVVQTELIDAAGGIPWIYRVVPQREGPPSVTFDIADDALRDALLLRLAVDGLIGVVPERHWFWIAYDPEVGCVRLIIPMATRRDLPTAERFAAQLTFLEDLAAENRRLQERP